MYFPISTVSFCKASSWLVVCKKSVIHYSMGQHIFTLIFYATNISRLLKTYIMNYMQKCLEVLKFNTRLLVMFGIGHQVITTIHFNFASLIKIKINE